MVATRLDQELAELLGPLVSLNPRFAVSPYVNTLCIAYHYRLAYGNRPLPADRMILIDWNNDFSSPEFLSVLRGRDANGFHIFYNTKDIAGGLRQLDLGWNRFYNSLAVTH